MSKGGNVKGSRQKVWLKHMEFATMTQRLSYNSDYGPHIDHILMGGLGHLSQMPENKGPYINISTRQSTPQKKQFPLLANIFDIITPKDNVSHQALQIPNSRVANVGSLSLWRVIHSRLPVPINVRLVLGATYT